MGSKIPIENAVLASGNEGKLKELSPLLASAGFELTPQSRFKINAIPETGASFVENALLKARHASRLTLLPAFADDSGLVVPSLNGAPGIYSARYAGVSASSQKNNTKLLEALHDSIRTDLMLIVPSFFSFTRKTRHRSWLLANGTGILQTGQKELTVLVTTLFLSLKASR